MDRRSHTLELHTSNVLLHETLNVRIRVVLGECDNSKGPISSRTSNIHEWLCRTNAAHKYLDFGAELPGMPYKNAEVRQSREDHHRLGTGLLDVQKLAGEVLVVQVMSGARSQAQYLWP